MTTDKIRAAAQALLDAYDNGCVLNGDMGNLRTALAVPAQAAPAADAVPVVAYEWTEEGFAGSPLKQWHDCPPGYVTSSRPLIYQRDHLAAMEALRQEVERLKACHSIRVSDYVNDANILGSDMPAAVVTKLQAAIDARRADRSAQVTEVMRLAPPLPDAFAYGPVIDCPGAICEQQRQRFFSVNQMRDYAKSAIEAAVRKLAGGA